MGNLLLWEFKREDDQMLILRKVRSLSRSETLREILRNL